MSGTALAANPTMDFEAGNKFVYEQTTGDLVFDSANTKEVQTTGGFWIGNGKNVDKAALVFGDAAYTVEAKGENVNHKLDSLIGGNYLRDAKVVKSATVGNTSLTLKGTTSEYIVGGSKLASGGKVTEATLVNGNVTLNVINATTTHTPKKGSDSGNVIGGNYVKNHNEAAKATAKVGDVNLTVGGTSVIGGKVFGGSYAERYQDASDKALTLDVTSGNLTTTLTGGTFNDHVIADNGVSGKGTTAASGATAVTVKADMGATVTLGTKSVLVARSFVEKLGMAKVTGDTNVTVTGECKVVLGKGIVGGTYMRSVSKDPTHAITSKVGGTKVDIRSGKINTNVIAGGKSNGLGGNIASTVEGDTFVTISGADTVIKGAVIGGGSAKSGQHTDDVGGTASTNVTIAGGTMDGVIGGGLSYAYGKNSAKSAISTTVKNSDVTVTGGTTNKLETNSGGSDQYQYDAAVIGGGVAVVRDDATAKPGTVHSASPESTQVVINGKDTKVTADVFAGGYADGVKADSTVKTASVAVKDVTLSAAKTDPPPGSARQCLRGRLCRQRSQSFDRNGHCHDPERHRDW